MQALQSGPSPQRSRLLPHSRSAQLFEVPPRVLPVPEAPAPQSFPLALAGAGRQGSYHGRRLAWTLQYQLGGPVSYLAMQTIVAGFWTALQRAVSVTRPMRVLDR